MNPVLTQIIDHPEFGCILPQAVAFAALGTNDRTVSTLRKAGKLIEGEHFVRVPQRAGMPRIHWTMTGLQALAVALSTDRAKAFQADLAQWLQTQKAPDPVDTAIEHQPRGYTVPPMPSEACAEYEPVSLSQWQTASADSEQEPPIATARYSLAELQTLKAIAQTERDGQMLDLLDKAISTIAASQPEPQSQPVERVVYVQPQKTINFNWHWQGGSHNNGSGSAEAFIGLILVTLTVIGVWLLAAAVVQNNRSTLQRSELNTTWEGSSDG